MQDPLLELTQGALEVVKGCHKTGLLVNLHKTGLVIFTRKYKVDSVEGSILGRTRLIPTSSVKFLEITIDRKLKGAFRGTLQKNIWPDLEPKSQNDLLNIYSDISAKLFSQIA